jgi:hypothetical protein
MAFGVKYKSTFQNRSGENVLVEILEDDYTGEVTRLKAAASPLTIRRGTRNSDELSPIIGTAASFSFVSETPFSLIEVINSEYFDYLMRVYIGDKLHFQGYIEPDIYRINPDEIINVTEITATCGLLYLKNLPFQTYSGSALTNRFGMIQVRHALWLVLSNLGVVTEKININWSNGDLISNFVWATPKMAYAKNAFDQLEFILRSYSQIIYQKNGEFWCETSVNRGESRTVQPFTEGTVSSTQTYVGGSPFTEDTEVELKKVGNSSQVTQLPPIGSVSVISQQELVKPIYSQSFETGTLADNGFTETGTFNVGISTLEGIRGFALSELNPMNQYNGNVYVSTQIPFSAKGKTRFRWKISFNTVQNLAGSLIGYFGLFLRNTTGISGAKVPETAGNWSDYSSPRSSHRVLFTSNTLAKVVIKHEFIFTLTDFDVNATNYNQIEFVLWGFEQLTAGWDTLVLSNIILEDVTEEDDNLYSWQDGIYPVPADVVEIDNPDRTSPVTEQKTIVLNTGRANRVNYPDLINVNALVFDKNIVATDTAFTTDASTFDAVNVGYAAGGTYGRGLENIVANIIMAFKKSYRFVLNATIRGRINMNEYSFMNINENNVKLVPNSTVEDVRNNTTEIEMIQKIF